MKLNAAPENAGNKDACNHGDNTHTWTKKPHLYFPVASLPSPEASIVMEKKITGGF